jgi:hypothetical protein
MRLIRWRSLAIKALAFVAALFIGGAAYLYSARAKPVLYRFDEPGNPVHEPAFAIFKPIIIVTTDARGLHKSRKSHPREAEKKTGPFRKRTCAPRSQLSHSRVSGPFTNS